MLKHFICNRIVVSFSLTQEELSPLNLKMYGIESKGVFTNVVNHPFFENSELLSAKR